MYEFELMFFCFSTGMRDLWQENGIIITLQNTWNFMFANTNVWMKIFHSLIWKYSLSIDGQLPVLFPITNAKRSIKIEMYYEIIKFKC